MRMLIIIIIKYIYSLCFILIQINEEEEEAEDNENEENDEDSLKSQVCCYLFAFLLRFLLFTLKVYPPSFKKAPVI